MSVCHKSHGQSSIAPGVFKFSCLLLCPAFLDSAPCANCLRGWRRTWRADSPWRRRIPATLADRDFPVRCLASGDPQQGYASGVVADADREPARTSSSREVCLSAAFNLDSKSTQNAAEVSVPSLLAGFASMALQPGGAQKVVDAVRQHASALDSLSNAIGDSTSQADGNFSFRGSDLIFSTCADCSVRQE
jgi:hypothetical protein